MSLLPAKTRKQICEFVDELAAQNVEGSWGGKSPELETSVVTCQATHLLSSFRGKPVAASLERAVEWLTGPAVASSEYTHWRFIPLLEAKASEDNLEQALNHLKEKVELGIRHHENSPLQQYYVMCRIKRGSLDSVAQQIVDDSLKELSAPPTSWSPETLAFKLAIVVLSGANPNGQLLEATMDRLISASTCKGDIRQWHSLVATAYIEMNLLQLHRQLGNTSAISKKILQTAEQTARYLVKQWDKGDFASEPLAGGVFDKTPYNKIVVARALVEFLDSQEPRWREPFLSEPQVPVVPPEIKDDGREHSEAKSQKSKRTTNPWISGSFYLVAFIAILILFVIIAQLFGIAVACVALPFGVIGLAAIGALQLRNDDRLKDESFLKLMLRVLAGSAGFSKRNKDRR